MSNIDTCKKCSNRKFDTKQGIVCGLTNAKPTFVSTCVEFIKDESVSEFTGAEIRPNGQRAKIAFALIWIVLACELLAIVSSVMQYNMLQGISKGIDIDMDAINANDMREAIIAILYLVVYVISGVTFIMWFRRAYYNLHQKVRNLEFEEGWAAGSWFVPIMNLGRPYKIMKELYEETKNFLLSKNESISNELNINILGAWWTLWILNNVLGRIIYRFSKGAESIPELITFSLLDIVNGIVGVILALVTVRVINNYSSVENLLEEPVLLYTE